MPPDETAAPVQRRNMLGPALRFILVCVAFFAWILITSILPAGRADNILRGVPKFNAVEAFGTPLLFWILGCLWVVRATTAARRSNIGTREFLVIAATVVALGAIIFIGAFFWWLLLASGPTR